MNQQELARDLLTFLSPFLPYLLRGGEKAVEEIGRRFGTEVWERAKGLWSGLARDPSVRKAARDVVERPEDHESRVRLQRRLERTLEHDRDLFVRVKEDLYLHIEHRVEGVLGNVTWIGGDAFFLAQQAPPALQPYLLLKQSDTITTEKSRDFVGRQFVFDYVEQFLVEPESPSGYLIIEGEPGIGKTALMAQLVKRYGWLHHYVSSFMGIDLASQFLGNICAQLVAAYDLDVKVLPHRDLHDSSLLLRLLGQVAEKADGKRIVILVDALDESDTSRLRKGSNRLYLPPDLPENVFVIGTTRPESAQDARLQLSDRDTFVLKDDDPRNLADIREYVHSYLHDHDQSMKPRLIDWGLEGEDFVQLMVDKSEGNFMYLVQVLRDMRRGTMTPQAIGDTANLPRGLRQYYFFHWNRVRDRIGDDIFNRVHKEVACFLAAAEAPVSTDQLMEWTGLERFEVKQALRDWRQFLNISKERQEPRHRIYHSSFQDFLLDEIGLESYQTAIIVAFKDKVVWN
jgi:hypothetical protein